MRVFAVVDGIHLWFSVPFNMLYPVKHWQPTDPKRPESVVAKMSSRQTPPQLPPRNAAIVGYVSSLHNM